MRKLYGDQCGDFARAYWVQNGKGLVSLAAVFWMSHNAPPTSGGALRDIQKTAARETSKEWEKYNFPR